MYLPVGSPSFLPWRVGLEDVQEFAHNIDQSRGGLFQHVARMQLQLHYTTQVAAANSQLVYLRLTTRSEEIDAVNCYMTRSEIGGILIEEFVKIINKSGVSPPSGPENVYMY